jgi:hypothetical protein
MKQWLYVDGPVRILEQVKKWDANIEAPNFVHYCQTCAFIYNSPEIQKVIKSNYKTILSDVQKRFVNKMKLNSILRENY